MQASYRRLDRGLFLGAAVLVSTVLVFGAQILSAQAATVKAMKIDKKLFVDANYKGPFPAPEGKMLLGKYGKDKFKNPTGKGDYRFRVQTYWQRDVQCLDSSRTVDKSLGKTWEKGFFYGLSVAEAELKYLDPVYDNTPKGTGSGKPLYDKGYEIGFDYRWGGSGDGRFGCPPRDGSVDLTQYDADGWKKWKNIKALKTIKTLYIPAGIGSVSYSSQSALGSDSVSLGLDNYLNTLEGSSFNNKKDPINLSRIDFLESETSAEELAMGPEKIMQTLYDQSKAEVQKKYANTVAFIYDKPSIETQTYGKNKFTVLQYVVANDGKWNLVDYALRIDPKTNMGLVMHFNDPKDISNEAKNGIDTSKTPGYFLAQLLTKMEFVNY